MATHSPDTQRITTGGVVSIKDKVYASYKVFIRQFQAASGTERELLTPDKFAKWWSTLSEVEQAEHSARFETGYQKPEGATRARQLGLIREYLS